MPQPISPDQIAAAHQLYCRFTGQSLRLGFDRERQWFEWLRAGFTPEDLRRVMIYLQREVRHARRNVGALKLSNLLQLDRFEEDLNISRIRLHAPARNPATPPAPLSHQELEARRLKGLEVVRRVKAALGLPPTTTAADHPSRPTKLRANHETSTTD